MSLLFCRELLKSAADNQPWESRSKILFWKGGNTHPAREAAVNSKKLRQSALTQIDFVNYTDPASSFVSLADHCHHKCATAIICCHCLLPFPRSCAG